MDTKKLRQKILDLAIHGKLVPQDPNDEPASVLLERIKAEKEQLIKEGKIKRQKKSASSDTSHYGNEVPFEVPEGWVWCRLKDITSFLSRGKSPQYSDERKYPVFAQKCNLKDGGISLVQARFLDPKTINKWGSEYKLCTGDVLINSTGTGTVGRTRIFNSNCLGTYPFVVPDSHVSVVRTFKEVNSYYIYMLISSRVIQEYLEDNLAGSTNQKELYIGVLEDLFVPLPPMDEQDRIVMKSNKLFSIIDCIEKEEENLSVAVQNAKSKILDLALSGKLTSDTSHYPQLPDGWKEVRLGDICRLISGTSYSKNDVKPDGIRILRGGNIQYGKVLLLDNDVYISTSLRNKECSLMKGDIIIVASTGSFDLIGKAGYIEQDISNAQIGAFLRIVRPIDSSISQYLRLIFESTLYRSHIQDLAKGTNINNIKASYITDFCIPLPPMGERKKICNIVKIISQQIDDIESSMLK